MTCPGWHSCDQVSVLGVGVDPVTAEALAELIASTVTAVAGRAWKQVRGTSEGRAVKVAIGAAVGEALRVSALPPGRAVGDAWVAEMDEAWRPAFTTEVSRQLVGCLADPSGDAAHRFADAARQALADSGCDLGELGRTLWVDEFLAVLPRRVFEALRAASVRDPAVRGLVDHVLRQRAEARASGAEPATPGELRSDLITLLHGLDEQANELPRYLPRGADVTALSRTVRVRADVRTGPGDPDGEDRGGERIGGVYRLPVERSQDSEPPRPWPEVAGEHRRLVVLADPGLGKSWLVRTETHRLCQEALARLAEGPGPVVIPVPLRCDQLATADGPDLADKAADYLVRQGLLAERSRGGVAAMVAADEAVVLLDALDELTEAESGPLRKLVRSWADQAGDRARCVITSRIAGYAGSPLPGAREVELQAFTPEDAAAAIDAWRLPPAAASQLRDRLEDSATGAMARIPLLLALLCSLAAPAPGSKALPATRGQLYERVLRWFLTGTHRSEDDPGTPERGSVEVDALLQILAPLAFTFATQPAGWTDLMPGDSLLNAIRATGPVFTELHRPAKDVLRELSVGAGVLVPDSDPSAGRSPHYLFLHRTVAEYLTARHLATRRKKRWLAIVGQHQWFDPDWAEVIPMLGERLSPDHARALIQHLLAGEHDPFGHALLTAARVWGARPDADHLLAPRQADELAGRLHDLLQHELTRHAASSACAAMTYLPRPVLTRLIACLTDPDERVRGAAAGALAGRQGPGVTEALLGCLTDPDERVRGAAAGALAGRQGPGVTEALLACLTDPDERVRGAAAGALAGRQGPGVTEALLACLTDPHARVREAAVGALAGREEPGVTRALLARPPDPDEHVRYAVTWALARPRLMETMLARPRDPDERGWHAAERALAGRHGSWVTEALRREGPRRTEALLALLTDPVEAARRAAARALAGRQGPRVTEALLACLTDPDAWVRRVAAEALAGRQDPGVTEALLACLTEAHTYVREAAARALAGRQGPGVTEALLARLTDPEVLVRGAAAGALAGRQDPGLPEALLARLTDPNALVRDAAAEALARRQDPATLLILARKVRTLNQPSLLAVTEAAEALMIRHYRRIDPADQPEVLAAMGWLTTAALSDRSA
jgi:HEAT repeat protein